MRPLIGCSLAAFVLVGSQAAAQSLAEAAAQEALRRAAIVKPVKVWTERDLVATPAPVRPLAPAPTITPVAPVVVDTGRDEAYWKDRMRTLQLKLAEDFDRAEAANRTALLLIRQHARADFATRIGLSAEVAKASAESRQRLATIDATRREIRLLEEEARQAGVPPGWLRIR